MTEAALLEVRDVSVAFGGVVALDGVALTVGRDRIHGLIGPNGAGKTTLLNVVSRIIPAAAGGTLRLDGRDISRLPPHHLATLGVTRTFQNLVLVEDATVLDNVRIGLHAAAPGGLLDELVLVLRRNRREAATIAQARAALARLDLLGVQDVEVRNLSYGTRKMVELARALAPLPRLLLLDEPTAGLNEVEIANLQQMLLRSRREAPFSILAITHHIEFLVGMADAITVLDLGRVIASDTVERVRADPAVIAAYVGEG